MTAAVLCPGPSLARTFDPDFGGLTLAVNRAALAYSADVWCANDLPLIDAIAGGVKGSPSLWCNKDSLASLQQRPHALAANGRAFAELECPVPAWHLFTASAALVVAAHLGATFIMVYGADWTDAPDFDGGTPPSCRRNADRWKQEQGIWSGVEEWLGSRGVSVFRVLADGSVDGACPCHSLIQL